MQLDRFEDRLDLYGSDLSAWPEDDRAAAMSLLEQSDEARSLLDEAQHLDTALATFTVDEPSAEFEARLLDLAPQPPRPAKARTGLFELLNIRLFVSTGAALACAAFGVVIGLNSISTPEWTDDADAFVTAAVTSYDSTLWEDGEEG